MIRQRRQLVFVLALLVSGPAFVRAQPQAWVARSNQHAKILLDVMARLAPEGAGRIGVEGLDAAITDISPGYEERAIAANRKALADLEKALASENDVQANKTCRSCSSRRKTPSPNGYTKLVDLRAEIEKKLGASFDQKAFHDFILSQGLLPPALMREAVLKRFAQK